MIDSAIQKEVLEKILASGPFRDGTKYQRLLRYLVDASLRGEVPKEVTIAIDVFNKPTDFNPSEDTSVRVQIHNLRKKLNGYYENEGKGDSIRLSIPKGHYQVKFTEFNPVINQGTTSDVTTKRSRFNIYKVFAILFGIATLFLIYDKMNVSSSPAQQLLIDKTDPIWGSFFNDLSTSLVIGDFLIFHEYDSAVNRMRRIQDYEINQKESLDVFIQENPGKQIEKWNLGELPHNSIFNVVDIYPVFSAFNKPMDINFSSEIEIDFIKDRNLIYVGEFKNLRALKNLTANLPIRYQTKPWWDGTIYIEEDTTIVLNTFHNFEKSRFIVDLALVAKLPGQNMENYLLIAGFGYDSQVKAVKMFSDPRELAELKAAILARHQQIPEYFVAILKVSGFDRASSNAEITYLKEIHPAEYRESFVRALQ